MLRDIGEKMERVRFVPDLNNRRGLCHSDGDDSVFIDGFRKCRGGRVLDHVDEAFGGEIGVLGEAAVVALHRPRTTAGN